MRAVAAASILVLLVPARARANDSEAVLEGGTLRLKKSDGIVMESEELTIAPDRVEVAYLFRNTTTADIATRVAFPFAPYPFEEGPLDAQAMAEERRRPRNDFGMFSLLVDGKPVRFETTADVTPDAVSVTHHWPQTFPAGKTVSIKHLFTPVGGFIYSFDQAGPLENGLAREYCVGPVLMQALKKREQGSIRQIHYVLVTGANWKGPIKRFVLRIRKERPKQKVSVCLDGLKKVDDRTFLLEATDFVPTKNLKIAYID